MKIQISIPDFVYDSIRNSTEGKGIIECNAKALYDAIYYAKPITEPEKKTGRWILTEKGAVATAYQCSICGRSIINDTGYDVYKDYPFCHCGAAMTEKQDD